MSPTTEIEHLFRLSLAIGESMDLEAMLHHFLAEMLSELGGSGGAVLQLHQADIGRAPVVCMNPEGLPRQPCYSAFWEGWSPTSLDRALAEHPEGRPIVSFIGGCAVHAFRLPDFGLLLFARDAETGALPTDFQRALTPLCQKLSNAAHTCLLEAQLRRQTQRLQLATDSAGIGIWEWDPISGHLEWDIQTCELFGITAEDLDESMDQWMQRVHPDDQTAVRRLIGDALRDRTQLEMEYRIVRPEGEVRHLRAEAAILRNRSGDPVRMIGVSLDITPTKTLQQTLRQARDMAESANRAKTRFIASMTHEIRTPLNGIIGLTELAIDTDLSPNQRDYVDLIRHSADTLLTLLNDILDLAKIDAGRMQIEEIPFNLGVMLREQLKATALTATSKGLSFELDQIGELPEQSIGDPGRIRQILSNLCDNAVKFTDQGEIRVQVETLESEKPGLDLIHVSVRDTGIGIPPDTLDEIFTAFTQGEATINRQFGGAGLGLTIAARLIDLIGGRIWVESEENRGSIFHVTFPLARATDADRPQPPLQHWPGKRALIADAHPSNRRMLAYWLRQWGFIVQEAGNSHQALELARLYQTKGDTIDIYLFASTSPDLDGFALARSLTENGLVAESQMIMISSGGKRGDAKRCRELGIGAFLTQPPTLLELRETLTHFFGTDAHAEESPLLTRHHLLEHRQRLRILLVEDNPIAQKLASSLLREWGHDVSIVNDGQMAVELYRTEPFHLIFMDLSMPGMDGIAASRAIRAMEKQSVRTPIIGMTAHALESDAERCLEAGMDEHLVKPLTPSVLEDVVLRLAKRQPLDRAQQERNDS